MSKNGIHTNARNQSNEKSKVAAIIKQEMQLN